MGNPLLDLVERVETRQIDQSELDKEELSEAEFNSLVPISDTDPSYYSAAQDFSELLQGLRLRHLGYALKIEKDLNGKVVRKYIKRKNFNAGITRAGLDFNISFLEDRLHKHSILMGWKEERMLNFLRWELDGWTEVMMRCRKKWNINDATFYELYNLVAYLLEVVYRRAIGDEERNKMTPISKEDFKRTQKSFGYNDGTQTQAQHNPQEMPKY